MPRPAAATTRVANPYAKVAQNVAPNANMGRQSQHCVSNQTKRKFKQASQSRQRAGDQLTLDNQVQFNRCESKVVGELVQNNKFWEKHKTKSAPLAMTAFANEAVGLKELF